LATETVAAAPPDDRKRAGSTAAPGREASTAQLLDLEAQRQAFATLNVDENAKWFLENVWLRYVAWWDRRAWQAKRQHYALRGVVLVGGAATPSLIGFSIGGGLEAMQWAAWVTGLLVAIAAAAESLFRSGEVWREKRAAGELLKIDGWRFLQLLGPYRGKTHAEAFPDFAESVERLIEHEIGDYLAAAIPRRDGSEQQRDENPKPPPTPVGGAKDEAPTQTR